MRYASFGYLASTVARWFFGHCKKIHRMRIAERRFYVEIRSENFYFRILQRFFT
ncbi:hypothetical protein LEP1GSC068_1457 [Leptospira sp. Fiocruz LV3954]|nr:hypothetical protein LEP1GSC068_1457 [Leptospira sp. Fiocruz LV3954]EMI63830.1 hypothetical protein LEP1GSC076_3068 [Leptospira sp. Fiocruz LV4135]